MFGFELWIAPKHSTQLGLTWKFYHHNKTLLGTKPNNFFYWKQTFDEKDTSPKSCSHQNAVWWTQIELVNFEWLSKTQYILDWFEIFTIETRLICATLPTCFYEIRTLDAKYTTLWIGLLDCVRTLFIPSGDEGLTLWRLQTIKPKLGMMYF